VNAGEGGGLAGGGLAWGSGGRTKDRAQQKILTKGKGIRSKTGSLKKHKKFTVFSIIGPVVGNQSTEGKEKDQDIVAAPENGKNRPGKAPSKRKVVTRLQTAHRTRRRKRD